MATPEREIFASLDGSREKRRLAGKPPSRVSASAERHR